MFSKHGTGVEQMTSITLVTTDPALQESVKALFDAVSDYDLNIVHGKILTQKAYLKKSNSALLIIEINPETQLDLDALEMLNAEVWTNAPIIIISDGLDTDTVRKLLHLGVEDWLPKSSLKMDLLPACQKALKNKPVTSSGVRSTCYAFYPTVGGVGNTVLSIEAAFALTEKSYRDNSRTCIVDLNFQNGCVADYLDLKPGLEIDEIAANPHRLDSQLLEVMLSTHSSGISVLAAPRFPSEHKVISNDFVENILGLVSDVFDNFVIDLPGTWYSWTDSVMHGADKMFVITEFTVPALQYARSLANGIRDKQLNNLQTHIIVNKYRQQLIGSGLVKQDVHDVLGYENIHFIPEDRRLVEEAINRGEPLSQLKKSNRIGKDLSRALDL